MGRQRRNLRIRHVSQREESCLTIGSDKSTSTSICQTTGTGAAAAAGYILFWAVTTAGARDKSSEIKKKIIKKKTNRRLEMYGSFKWIRHTGESVRLPRKQNNSGKIKLTVKWKPHKTQILEKTNHACVPHALFILMGICWLLKTQGTGKAFQGLKEKACKKVTKF